MINIPDFLGDNSRQTFAGSQLGSYKHLRHVSTFLFCDLLQIFEVTVFPRLHIFLEDSPQIFNKL